MNSNSIFDTITYLTFITEKRFLIDLSALREAYKTGAIQNLVHMLTQYNLADPLIKKIKSALLVNLLEVAIFYYLINQWIMHRTPQNSFDVKES